MVATTTINAFGFVKVAPRGGGNPVAINPAQIVSISPLANVAGARIALSGPNSSGVETDLTVDQVLALFTPA